MGLGISYEKMMQMDRMELKRKIRDWDNMTWHNEMQGKSTLILYREEKIRIKYEECYYNSTASSLYAKARTNCLELEESYGRGDKGRHHDTTCRLCQEETEDLPHFPITCKKMNKYREKDITKE